MTVWFSKTKWFWPNIFFFLAQFADEKRVYLGFGLPKKPASLEAKPSEALG
jgi:hypothetical protein